MLPSGTDTSSAAAPLQDLENDPLSINKPATKLTHQLCLASAYGAYGDAADNGPEVARQKGRVDHDFFEPKFSNVGRDFKGTLDYILYTTDTLVPVGLLELPDDADLEEHAPGGRLPCANFSSDHIALMAEFQYRRHPQGGH